MRQNVGLCRSEQITRYSVKFHETAYCLHPMDRSLKSLVLLVIVSYGIVVAGSRRPVVDLFGGGELLLLFLPSFVVRVVLLGVLALLSGVVNVVVDGVLVVDVNVIVLFRLLGLVSTLVVVVVVVHCLLLAGL
jgi:hypothetical protein